MYKNFYYTQHGLRDLLYFDLAPERNLMKSTQRTNAINIMVAYTGVYEPISSQDMKFICYFFEDEDLLLQW